MPLRINKTLSVLIFWATLYMTLSENNSCFHDMPCTSDVFSEVKIILITILKVFFSVCDIRQREGILVSLMSRLSYSFAQYMRKISC